LSTIFSNAGSASGLTYIAPMSKTPRNMDATVLVIDDDDCMRQLLDIHLSHAGYAVVQAEDPIVAARALLQESPDIIVMDVEMPFMDGLEFLQVLKADAATASIPVVFLTCHTEAEPRAKQLGAAAFLTKPLRAEDLLATLAKHVDTRLPA
jgi:CheY-like chemotaxis protein